ncbi:MAG: hypothetical protein ACFFD8_05825 [Candidatus Thorarchaeota archaeon]
MTAIRQAFNHHSETVRDYLIALIQVDSGIYNIDQLKTILQEPDTTVRMETNWLQSLLTTLHFIQQYIQLVQKWDNHTRGLAKNLGANQRDIDKFENQEISAAQMLESKKFDQKYLRWVLEDTAQELDRLIASSHELISNVPLLLQLTAKFQGPFLEGVSQIAANWEKRARHDFLIPLSTILQEIDTRGDSSMIIQQFCRYLETIIQVVTAMPMLVMDSSAIISYSRDALQASEGIIRQLLEGTENLRQFVQLRSQVYSVLINEQKALLHAVMPFGTPVSQVLITMGLNPSQTVDGLLPDPLPTDTLPLALHQADEALALWNATIETSIPYLNKALVLNQLLQSPTIAQFLKAEQRRLELYHEWQPRITETLKELRSSLSS